ncbi:MAG: hypothetical protein AD742_18785 [Methylibium sp. NZG]|nr:MAG: hypothetical protein AD742_18785 [Methylibium sp. NZG]
MIQLQQDRMYANWRRLNPADEYVRFPAVRDEFIRVFDLFQQYVLSTTEVAIKPVRYELTYVNILRQGNDYAEVAELGRVFRDFGWNRTERYLGNPLKLGAKYEFSLPDDLGSLGVSADPVRNNETGENMFRLQLAAVAPIDVVGNASFEEWIEAAHEQIVRGFMDLTSDRMHERWGLVPEESKI